MGFGCKHVWLKFKVEAKTAKTTLQNTAEQQVSLFTLSFSAARARLEYWDNVFLTNSADKDVGPIHTRNLTCRRVKPMGTHFRVRHKTFHCIDNHK